MLALCVRSSRRSSSSHPLTVTATAVAAAAGMPALSSGAAFTRPIVAGIPGVTLPVSRLVRMEVIERLFPAPWKRSIVTVMRIIAIVNVAVKAVRAMKPWARSDEKSTAEPIRSIVAIWRTAVGRIVEVTVWAVRSCSEVDANLSPCIGSGSRQADSHNT
jgi:hypothetical protein